MQKFTIPSKIRNILIAFIAVGVISLAAGFAVDPHRAWAGFLAMAFFVTTLALSGGFFTALQFIAGARWSIVIRRVTETMMSVLPIALLLVIGVLFGMKELYHWTTADLTKDHILHAKSAYLNVPFFIGRIFGYFALMGGIWFFIRKISLKQDETKDAAVKSTLVKWSAGYMVAFAYAFALMALDLIMSLEPHWYSTMFPVYAFAGLAYSGLAAIIILVTTIRDNNGLKEVNVDHLHDLGKFQFMFTVFWAYIAFSQFMLIWYANLSEETIYLEIRLKGEWKVFTILFWLMHFAVPFAILLSRDIKRSAVRLRRVAWYILFMGFVDIIWVTYGGIYEHFHHKGFPFSWMELGLFFGAVGIFGYIVLLAYSKVNPVPIGDPHLEESIHFHQTH